MAESCKSASALDSAGEDMSSVPAATHVPVCDTGASSAAGSSDRLDASCVDEPVPVNGSSEDALVGRPASKKGKAKKGKADSSNLDLGSFFEPPKRKVKLVSSLNVTECSRSQDFNVPLSKGASRAASREAWKRRGQMGDCASLTETASSSSCAEVSQLGPPEPGLRHLGRDRSESQRGINPRRKAIPGDTGWLGRRSACGLQRVDSTRCHWLPPESLLIRVDPETSLFLQRLWFGYSLVATQASKTKASLPRTKRSVPARLHAGWLAHTLRPTGWLASIPEDKVKNLPMPYSAEFLTERDPPRGRQRAFTAATERMILELVEDVEHDLEVPVLEEELDEGEFVEAPPLTAAQIFSQADRGDRSAGALVPTEQAGDSEALSRVGVATASSWEKPEEEEEEERSDC